MQHARWFLSIVLFSAVHSACAAQQPDLKAILSREIIGPRRAMADLQKYLEPRIPAVPQFQSVKEWEAYAEKLRSDMLTKVVYRGEAANWRDAQLNVEWLETVPGGTDYHIKKLRFEALPGLWIPAVLYEPEKLAGKVPATLNVMGHDGGGKEVAYQQIRCINLAKRGMLALNVEWFGFGQLKGANYAHTRMNQLDLCGTSGLAPFYLALKRGLDVLLSHEHADPHRIAVSGLSGGGWQTIYISSLDTRVSLCNPVAGYSSFRTRIRHLKDLGDPEQTPCDMATVADYTHLTALLAPRAALLTYNSKDECCFESGYALPPLLEAALPAYKLHDRATFLRSHVNDVPGTHNYEQENREAFYRMIGDHFFPGDKSYSAKEIPCANEVKKPAELAVPMPAKNADFNSLARVLCKDLPRRSELPKGKEAIISWQERNRRLLRDIVRAKDYQMKVPLVNATDQGGLKVQYWTLPVGDEWQVPAVELAPGKPKATVILINDGGRSADVANVEKWLADGYRVLAVDPFYIGESKMAERGYLFSLLVSAIGQRPLGVQAGQLAAIARWARTRFQTGPVLLSATGPRTSLIALTAAALEPADIGEVRLRDSLGSLKQIIENNRTIGELPEMFCFGLLERFDLKHIAALVAPRPVRFVNPSQRVQAEMGELTALYGALGVEFEAAERKNEWPQSTP